MMRLLLWRMGSETDSSWASTRRRCVGIGNLITINHQSKQLLRYQGRYKSGSTFIKRLTLDRVRLGLSRLFGNILCPRDSSVVGSAAPGLVVVHTLDLPAALYAKSRLERAVPLHLVDPNEMSVLADVLA